MPDLTNPSFKILVNELGFTAALPGGIGYHHRGAEEYHTQTYARRIPNRPVLHLNCSSFTKNNIPARVWVYGEMKHANFTIVGNRRVVKYLQPVVDAVEALDYCLRSPA